MGSLRTRCVTLHEGDRGRIVAGSVNGMWGHEGGKEGKILRPGRRMIAPAQGTPLQQARPLPAVVEEVFLLLSARHRRRVSAGCPSGKGGQARPGRPPGRLRHSGVDKSAGLPSRRPQPRRGAEGRDALSRSEGGFEGLAGSSARERRQGGQLRVKGGRPGTSLDAHPRAVRAGAGGGAPPMSGKVTVEFHRSPKVGHGRGEPARLPEHPLA